ncbi:hypothetical protein JW906_16485 [bacterium]|nr:hypothetical protein [bacterium]
MKRNILLLAPVLLLSGCVNPFAPRLTHQMENADLIITLQATPDEVLQNFKVAYAFRDSLLYSNLLDTGFMFVFFDPNQGTSGMFVSWLRNDDLRTTGRLFRHFQIIQLLWKSTIYASMDSTGGMADISKEYHLTLTGKDSDYMLTGRAVFSFRKGPDEKWRIVCWKDESDL